MNVFFDTEFTGLHKDTTLISIGLISEDNRRFYAEFNDYDKNQVNDWIKENVIDNLLLSPPKKGEQEYYIKSKNQHHIPLTQEWNIVMRGSKQEIKKELEEWLNQFNEVQFISDVCHYDMVLLIDIFGTAFDLPCNCSSSCCDINQIISQHYNILQVEAFNKRREDILEHFNICIEGKKHNSLYDAKTIKAIYENFTKND